MRHIMIRAFFGGILAVLLAICTGLVLLIRMPLALGSMRRYYRIRNM
jgi:hypothetical protein